jgi:hypothetical protein
MAIGQELLNVPMGDMIKQMAFAIAEAQLKLDESSINSAELMGGLTTIVDKHDNVTFDDSRVFFGHEYMKPKEALLYAAMDDAMTGTKPGDHNSLRKLYDKILDGNTDDDLEVRVPTRVSMLELGFTPNFYQFVDTIIEVKIAIKITREREYSRTKSDKDTSSANQKKRKHGGVIGAIFGGTNTKDTSSQVSTSQVDATYSSKYSYSAEGSSLLRTKLSPVPPPPILEERIRNLMEMEQARRDTAFKEEEVPA